MPLLSQHQVGVGEVETVAAARELIPQPQLVVMVEPREPQLEVPVILLADQVETGQMVQAVVEEVEVVVSPRREV